MPGAMIAADGVFVLVSCSLLDLLGETFYMQRLPKTLDKSRMYIPQDRGWKCD